MNSILYHRNCTDGFMSAFLLHLYFKDANEECEFIAVEYNEPVPLVKGKNVYVVDFIYPPHVVEQWVEEERDVLILDHHLGAADMYGGYGDYFVKDSANSLIRIREHNSGAGLVYEFLRSLYKGQFFKPKFIRNKRLELLVNAVEDYDLWSFKIQNTEVYQEFLSAMPRTFYDWEWMIFHMSDDEFHLHQVKALGCVEMVKTLTRTYAEKSSIITFAGHQVPLLNIPRNYVNSVGNHLAPSHPFVLMYSVDSKLIQCSLRSHRDTGVNVNDVAAQYGGGGHMTSAGFRLPVSKMAALVEGDL